MLQLKTLLTIVLIISCLTTFAQIGINENGSDPDASAMLDVSSNSKGFLMPRMTQAQRLAIQNPATGLMVYQTDYEKGFYYNQGTSSSADWLKIGDTHYFEDPREEIDSVTHNAVHNGKYTMYLITKPGSYYLTKNIVSSQDDAFGVIIASNDVTLDLNGYSLLGRSTGSTGSGVFIDGTRLNITIKNGFSSGWKGHGIDVTNATNTLLTELIVSSNGGSGFATGNQISLIECISSSNVGSGFQIGNQNNLIRCISAINTSNAYTTGSGCQLINCTANQNQASGYVLGANSMVNGSTSYKNGQNGYDITDGCSVLKSTACYNTGIGVKAATDCYVSYCNIAKNNLEGIQITGTRGTLFTNLLYDNEGGINCTNLTNCDIKIENNQMNRNNLFGIKMASGGGLVIRNRVSADNIPHYVLHANTNFGPVVTVTNVGDISTVTNANHPFANFSY